MMGSSAQATMKYSQQFTNWNRSMILLQMLIMIIMQHMQVAENQQSELNP